MTEPKPKSFEHWACVEILGHQSVVGKCSEEQIAGATLLRVDVPDGDSFVTHTSAAARSIACAWCRRRLRGSCQRAAAITCRRSRGSCRAGAVAPAFLA